MDRGRRPRPGAPAPSPSASLPTPSSPPVAPPPGVESSFVPNNPFDTENLRAPLGTRQPVVDTLSRNKMSKDAGGDGSVVVNANVSVSVAVSPDDDVGPPLPKHLLHGLETNDYTCHHTLLTSGGMDEMQSPDQLVVSQLKDMTVRVRAQQVKETADVSPDMAIKSHCDRFAPDLNDSPDDPALSVSTFTGSSPEQIAAALSGFPLLNSELDIEGVGSGPFGKHGEVEGLEILRFLNVAIPDPVTSFVPSSFMRPLASFINESAGLLYSRRP